MDVWADSITASLSSDIANQLVSFPIDQTVRVLDLPQEFVIVIILLVDRLIMSNVFRSTDFLYCSLNDDQTDPDLMRRLNCMKFQKIF